MADEFLVFIKWQFFYSSQQPDYEMRVVFYVILIHDLKSRNFIHIHDVDSFSTYIYIDTS